MTTFGLAIMALYHQVSVRIQSELALLAAQAFGVMPAAPSPPPIRCELANATETPMDFIVGNILGMAQKYGPFIVVGGFALMVFGIHRLRKGSGLVGFLISVVGAMLLLGMLMHNMSILQLGMTSSKTCP